MQREPLLRERDAICPFGWEQMGESDSRSPCTAQGEDTSRTEIVRYAVFRLG